MPTTAPTAHTAPPPVHAGEHPDVSAAPPDDSLYVRNLAALWRQDPKLAHRIDQIDDEQRLPLTRCRSGDLTVYADAPSGKTCLHSRYDPRREARQLIDSVPVDDKFCFVVLGFGLGYHVRELADRLKGDAFIIVTEPSLPLLSTAFACLDFSDLIASGRLIILDRLDKAALHDRLARQNTLIMLGAQFVLHPPSGVLADAFHAQARRLLTDFVAYCRMTLLTLVGNAEATCRNIAYNLPTYLATPPIDALRDRFQGRPGIVISGGPSLRRNLHLLSRAQGHAPLIAVQTVFKPLLARGIVPDFVTSLDFHSVTQQYFHGVTDFTQVRLIAEPKINWRTLDLFKGPVSLLHSPFADQLVGSDLTGRDGLRAGATVAHLAFYFAEYLGCDPIIFVGQDLAFTGHCFYVPGVEVHHTWQSELNRFNSLETKEWERIVRNRDILRKVPDLQGREVYTDELLLTYLEQFERDLQSCSATVINATEGGAGIRGTKVMTLAEALDRHCKTPLPHGLLEGGTTTSDAAAPRLQAAATQIDERIREIQALHDVCEEMLTRLRELQTLTGDPPRFNQRLVRVDELRTVVHRSSRAYNIVNAATQLAELQRYTADRKLEASTLHGPDRAQRQLARDLTFVEAIARGALTMLDILAETRRRLDAAVETATGATP